MKLLLLFFFLFQICRKQHLWQMWVTQPVLNYNINALEFTTPYAILASGNSFEKISHTQITSKLSKLTVLKY